MLFGKCPACTKNVSHVQVRDIKGHTFGAGTYNLAAYHCPHCATVLGVQMDPLALMADTVNRLIKRLREGK